MGQNGVYAKTGVDVERYGDGSVAVAYPDGSWDRLVFGGVDRTSRTVGGVRVTVHADGTYEVASADSPDTWWERPDGTEIPRPTNMRMANEAYEKGDVAIEHHEAVGVERPAPHAAYPARLPVVGGTLALLAVAAAAAWRRAGAHGAPGPEASGTHGTGDAGMRGPAPAESKASRTERYSYDYGDREGAGDETER